MKKIIGFVGLVFCLMSYPSTVFSWDVLDQTVDYLEENLDDGSMIGLGVLFPESPYAGDDEDVFAAPILFLESRQFFISDTVAGYFFNEKDEQLRLGMIVGPHFGGYDDEDSDVLSGMEDRDWGFDGGLRLQWKTDLVDLTLDGVGDLSDTHEGQEIRMTASKTFLEGFLKPRVGIKWQSEDLIDYYYGVKPNESRAGRAEYEPDSEIEYMAGLTVAVPLGEKWAVVGDVQCSFLGDEVRNSPIVDKDYLMRYVLGAVYRF